MTIKRGCGKRVPGGVYLVTDVVTDKWALPIDSFLFDPPWVPTDKEHNPYYPKAIGVQFVENPHHPSRMDVWDWIGEEHYPYFPDFWEEARRFGISRRIAVTANFSNLSIGSQLIGFHNKAILHCNVQTRVAIKNDWVNGVSMPICPQGKEFDHDCVSTLWQLVDQQENDEFRLHAVHMPRNSNEKEFGYMAASMPHWMTYDVKGRYRSHWVPAAMFHLPIHRIEVIEDTVERKHELPMEIVNKSLTDIPLQLVKE